MSSYKNLQAKNKLLQDKINELQMQLITVSINNDSAEARYIKSFYRQKYMVEQGMWHGDAGEYKHFTLTDGISKYVNKN